jgi:hypothetical protein
VGALRIDLGDLRLSLDQVLLQHATQPPLPAASASIELPPLPRPTDLRGDLGKKHVGDDGRHGPIGHRIDNIPRGSVMGPPPLSTPAKGTFPFPFESYQHVSRDESPRERGNTPQVDCPSFNGDGR